MTRRWLRSLGLTVLVAAMALGLAACGSDDAATNTNGGGGGEGSASPVADLAGPKEFAPPQKGGTYRVGLVDFGFTNAFDPTGEYLGSAHTVLSQLLQRNLVSYKFTAGGAGNELVPDLATALPEPSADNTYTFTLKDGVTFGPPLNRPITSKDIAYALERIGTPSLAAQYGFYYNEIKGMKEFIDGKAKTISGVTTPDDTTISITLTKPVGDFLYRMGMPAAAAMPREVAACHKNAGEYGRYLVSAGPYMFEGADKLDATSCATQKPISGFNPTTKMNLVRNPNYDPASDDTSIRQSFPDRFEFSINTNEKDIFDKIAKGELESSFDSPTPDILRQYIRDDSIRDQLRVNGGDRTWFITMNLAVAPFDDVNVRKAANAVMDLEGLQRAWGGPTAGAIATHILPNSMVPGAFPADFAPYQGPPYAGDEAAAKELMKLSAYDTDKDGLCDAPACKGVLHFNRNYGPWAAMTPIIEASFAKIGITLATREQPTSPAYTNLQNVSKKIPVGSNPGWGKDYADPSTFAVLFDGRNIIPTGNSNYALVGLTAETATKVKIDYPAGGVPSVDADIDACSALLGQERTDCWVAFDTKLTEEIVPWVPYLDAANVDLIGPSVTNYDYDQFSGEQALAHVAVDPSKQK